MASCSLLPLLGCWLLSAVRLLQLGVLVQHREACRSVLCFLTRLFDPFSAVGSLQQQHGLDQAAAVALLQQQLVRVGPTLVRVLLGGAVGALPISRVEDIAPVLQGMLKFAGGQGPAFSWISEVVMLIPDVALTAADKQAFIGAAAAVVGGNASMDGGCEGLEDALVAMTDLCRRNKRASRAAQAAVLPPEVHALVGLL